MNNAWRRKVGTTMEWSALKMVRVDLSGYLQFLVARHELRPLLCERVEDELFAVSVLLAKHLVDFADQPESKWSETGSVGPTEEEKCQSSARMIPRASDRERKSSRSSPCGSTNFSYDERFVGRGRNFFYWSEEEEIEAYALSMDSLMRVYYPSHSMRVN